MLASLNKLFSVTNAHVVLAGWMADGTKEEAAKKLKEFGLVPEVIGAITYGGSEFTTEEKLNIWLEKHKDFLKGIGGIVIISSDPDYGRSSKHKVLISKDIVTEEEMTLVETLISKGYSTEINIGKVEVRKSTVTKEMTFGGQIVPNKQLNF